jgi:fructosamine-3-kinase
LLIFQWELSLVGDPYFDLAKVFMYAIKQDRQKENAFMQGYCSKCEVTPDFMERMRVYSVHHLLEQWIFHAKKGNEKYLDNIHATLVNKLI